MRRFVLASAATALFLFGMGSANSARADVLEVQVGYADSVRSSPFFPVPWAGGPGVALFAGSTIPGTVFDSGAVRIINNDTVAHVINDLLVDKLGDGSSYHLWGSFLGAGFSLAPGMSAIFAQPGTDDTAFDTSDHQGGDVLKKAQPRVAFAIDGLPFINFDTAQVLNTEGDDHLAQMGLNESHQWRDIGTFGGQAAVPEPASLTILGIGLVSMAGYTWRRRKMAPVAC
jgi:hypothetical protein